MSVKDGLLALLVEEPKHGYQLKLDFEEATGGAWPLNIGQVYTSLQRLERDGLIEPDGDDGDRRTFRLTLSGRDHLDRWLVDPVVPTTETRDEVAMKILLAVAGGRGDPIEVVRAQRDATMRTLQELTRRRRGTGDLAWHLHLDRVSLACRAELDWLDLVEERLHDRDGTRPVAATDAPGTRTRGNP